MTQSTLHSAVPFAILRKLRLVRQRKMFVHAAIAIVAAIAVLVAAMGVAMLIDWLATLYDSRWRFVLTLVALATAALTGLGWLLVAWRRLLGIERIAGDVDRQLPQLAERWTTMTRLGADAENPEVIHPAMLRRVASEAAHWEPYVEPEQVVSMSALMRAMLCLTTVTAVLGIAVVLNSHRTLVLLQRFWLPGSSISATRLVNVPGNVVVGRGEPLALAAAVAGTPVEKAILFLRSEADTQRAITLAAHGQEPIEFSHRVRAVETPFEYRFRAGDGQTDWFTVEVAERPEIDKLELTVTPPAYTRQAAKSFAKLPARVAALEKSELELALRPTIPVESAVLRFGNDKHVPLKADADGWFRWKTTLKEGFTLTPVLTELHGLTNRRAPKCQITVYQDKPPAVRVLTPDDTVAVRPDDTLQITFSASDDVGIGTAELLVYDEAAPAVGGEPVPIAAIPIPLGDQEGARSVQQTIDLDLTKFVVDDGSELSYEIRVQEDRGTSAPPAANQQAANTAASASPSSASAASQVSSSSSASTGEQSAQSAAAKSKRESRPGATESQDSMPPHDRTAPLEQKELVARREDQPAERGSASSAARPSAQEQAAADKLASNSQSPKDSSRSAPGSESRGKGQPQSSTTASTAKSMESGAKPSADTAKLSSGSEKIASSSASATMPTEKTPIQQQPTPRTASTGRQSLAADRAEPMSPPDEPAPKTNGPQNQAANTAKDSSRSSSSSQQAENNRKNDSPKANQQANAPKQSQSGNSPAQSDDPQQASSASDPPPGDAMARRSLDIAQASSSNRMRLTVDRWAGSFEGQQRAKLEMAIGPELEALDQALAKSQKTARGVLDELEADKEWRGTHDRDVGSAERSTVEAIAIVKKLQDRSKDTPYAFIGLQVADISLAHIDPARSNFWKALESEGADRATSVRDAWQHLGRARQLVAELRGQYERTRREFQLAEAVERVKKMYQVYIENSQALLQTQDGDPTRYNRKLAEFELDDEYLKRLKEVLEMRRDLQAELARILAEDPRLLRRYMDALRYRTNNLREELANLVASQADLNREVRAWTLVEESDRPRIGKILLLRQVQDASKIAAAAGELQSRYQTWLPLDRESKDADLAEASKSVQEMATAASELNATAQRFVAESQRVTVATPPSETEAAAAEPAEAPPVPNPSQELDQMLTDAQTLYGQLNELEVALRQISAREEGAETAVFDASRLVETRRLIADSSAWVRQLRAHQTGNYTSAAEVDQYRLAMKTDELAGKLGSIEQTLAGLMQRSDGSLPAPIAEKAREFITALDKQALPNQLAAVYALHSNQLPRATERQKAAGDALSRAEKAYDEMVRLAIKELDKLPVQDPVADLLDDPTLDELLAQLEQELPIDELLGIPQRPSNLQVIGDWLRPGNGMGSGGGRIALNQLRQNDQQARQRLNRAYQRAIARALKEAAPKRNVEIPKPAKLSDWNRLVSQLGDDLRQGRDKAPPEQYRRAIEQYFSQISRVVAESENAIQ